MDIWAGKHYGPCDSFVSEHFTQPPKQYTEDTLLSAMERAGNEELTEDTEKKGLGTPATRAAIIEKLIQSGFVKREKKNLVPTDDGNVLITVLPDEIKSPKMTAEWEMALNHIAQNTETADEFLNGITELMQELVARYQAISEEKKEQFQGKAKGEVIGKCPRCGADVREGKVNFYCSDRNCAFAIGHAFESMALAENRPVLHGYAVAWGIVCELYLSHLKVGFPKEKMRQTIQFIKDNYGVFTFDCKKYDQLYAFMTHDKKNTSGTINFTLLKDIGDICINQTADKDTIFEMLDFYRECMGI